MRSAYKLPTLNPRLPETKPATLQAIADAGRQEAAELGRNPSPHDTRSCASLSA